MAEEALISAVSGVAGSAGQYLQVGFYTAVLLITGYIIGRLVYASIYRLLRDTNIDNYFGGQSSLELEPSMFIADIGRFVTYFIFLWIVTAMWGQQVGVNVVALFEGILGGAITQMGSVLVAIIVLLAGYGIAVYTKDRIVGSETLYADLLGKTIFAFVLYVAIVTALEEVGIAVSLLNNILLIIVGSIGLAFAIAAGWGLKDVFREEAQRYIEER